MADEIDIIEVAEQGPTGPQGPAGANGAAGAAGPVGPAVGGLRYTVEASGAGVVPSSGCMRLDTNGPQWLISFTDADGVDRSSWWQTLPGIANSIAISNITTPANATYLFKAYLSYGTYVSLVPVPAATGAVPAAGSTVRVSVAPQPQGLSPSANLSDLDSVFDARDNLGLTGVTHADEHTQNIPANSDLWTALALTHGYPLGALAAWDVRYDNARSDLAGTTAVATPGPVGWLRDLTGNGSPLVADLASTRPTWRIGCGRWMDASAQFNGLGLDSDYGSLLGSKMSCTLTRPLDQRAMSAVWSGAVTDPVGNIACIIQLGAGWIFIASGAAPNGLQIGYFDGSNITLSTSDKLVRVGEHTAICLTTTAGSVTFTTSLGSETITQSVPAGSGTTISVGDQNGYRPAGVAFTAAAVYDRVLTSQEIAAAIHNGRTHVSSVFSVNSPLIQSPNDSITAGYTTRANWPRFMQRDSQPLYQVCNQAETGRTFAQLVASAPYEVFPRFDSRRAKDVLALFCFTNSINAGVSGATLATDVRSFCQRVLRDYPWVQILLGDICPRTDFDSTRNTQKDAFNSQMATWFPAVADSTYKVYAPGSGVSWAKGLIRLRDKSELSVATSTTYYLDGIHWKPAGSQVAGTCWGRACSLLVT